jgi:peptidoglycan/LPS O-acetylase OafA/YrhL
VRAFNFIPDFQQSIVGGGWTIGVEMIFYAMFPLLALSLWQLSGALVFLCAALITWYVASGSSLAILQTLTNPVGVIRHLPVFAMGCVGFAMWFGRPTLAARTHRGSGRAIIAIALTGIAALAYTGLGGHLLLRWYIAALFYTALLLGVGMAPDRWLVNRVTMALGRISYSLYLVHFVVISRLTPTYISIYAQGWS